MAHTTHTAHTVKRTKLPQLPTMINYAFHFRWFDTWDETTKDRWVTLTTSETDPTIACEESLYGHFGCYDLSCTVNDLVEWERFEYVLEGGKLVKRTY